MLLLLVLMLVDDAIQLFVGTIPGTLKLMYRRPCSSLLFIQYRAIRGDTDPLPQLLFRLEGDRASSSSTSLLVCCKAISEGTIVLLSARLVSESVLAQLHLNDDDDDDGHDGDDHDDDDGHDNVLAQFHLDQVDGG